MLLRWNPTALQPWNSLLRFYVALRLVPPKAGLALGWFDPFDFAQGRPEQVKHVEGRSRSISLWPHPEHYDFVKRSVKLKG